MRGRDVAAWVVVGLAVAFLLVRLLGAEGVYPLVPLMAYFPYLVPLGLLLAGALALAGARLQAAVALAVAALSAFLVLPRTMDGPTPDARGPELTVMSANLAADRTDPREIADLVRRHDVDVLAIQELRRRSVARLRRAGVEALLPHAVAMTGPGIAGGGVYSRLPVLASEDLTPDQFFPTPDVLLRAPGAGTVRVLSVHPYPPTGLSETSDWEEALGELPAPERGTPTMLIGDFNGTLDHARVRDVLGLGYVDAADATGSGLAPSWPTGRFLSPPVTIDHVMVDERTAVRGYETVDLGGSGDHRGLVAELQLPER